MSRLPKRISRNAVPKLTGDALAAAMMERVRHYHQLGKLEMSVQDLKRKYGLSLSAAYKANQFAESYSVNEMKAFLRLRRNASGRPLHWGHIQYLLVVPWRTPSEKAIREELQKKAAELDWSPKELLDEIRKRFPGERGPGGRPRKIGLIPSIITQVDDASLALKRLVGNLGAADKKTLRNLEMQIRRLDIAVRRLRARMERARDAAAAARRRLS